MWSHPAATDEMSEVSLIGEQWSPNTPPPRTALTMSGTETGSPAAVIVNASGTASGIMMANVPQLVPMEKAMRPVVRKATGAATLAVR